MNRVNCLPGELVMGDSWDWGPQRQLFEFPGALVVYRKKGLAWPHRITHASRKTYSTYQQPSTYLYSVHLATATAKCVHRACRRRQVYQSLFENC